MTYKTTRYQSKSLEDAAEKGINTFTVNSRQPPETAPKDATIIANVGLPFAVVAMWNGASEKWVYANIQAGMYHGEWNDYYFEWHDFYFENEYEDELLGWMPMPEVMQMDGDAK